MPSHGAQPDADLPADWKATNPRCYQQEYGYLFGFIPIHVNSSLFDMYDFFEFPQWHQDYVEFNKFQDRNPEVVDATMHYIGSNHIPPPPATLPFYGEHLKEPFDNQRNIRRSFEHYQQDADLQRTELENYGAITTRNTTSRPMRFFDGSMSVLPRDAAAPLQRTESSHGGDQYPQMELMPMRGNGPTIVTASTDAGHSQEPVLTPGHSNHKLGYLHSSNYHDDLSLGLTSTPARHNGNIQNTNTSETQPLHLNPESYAEDHPEDHLQGPYEGHHDYTTAHGHADHAPEAPAPPEVVTSFTFETHEMKPPFVTHAFYERSNTMLPRLFIEVLIAFSMNFNVELSYISPVGAWGGAIVSCMLIYSALHVSFSFVNSGILSLVIGLAGFQTEHIYYFFCHGLGQFLAHFIAYHVIPGWVTGADDLRYVTSNLGVPRSLTMGTMIYHPLVIAFFESLTLGVIAISFTGKKYMKDAAANGHYFICTCTWSYITNLFRPYIPITFDPWYGFWVPIMTYTTTDTMDWETLLYTWAIYPIAVLCGAYIAGIFCRLSMHLEQRRYERSGHYAVHKLLSFMPPVVRDLYYDKLRSKQFDDEKERIEKEFIRSHAHQD